MKSLIFTVYDQKAEAYLPPFLMQTIGQALRAWKDVVNDTKTAFNKHPQDYTLFEIGTFDDSNAVLEQHRTPISKGTALEFLEQNLPNLMGQGSK